MENSHSSKKTLIVIPLSLFAIFMLSMTPAVLAYGKTDNWQMGFAGTFIAPGGGNFGFWGWCALSGVSSGSDGDCQVSNYGHIPGVGSFTCETSFDITGWTSGTSASLPPFLPGLFITSGHVTAHPAKTSFECLSLSFPPGVVDPSTGNIIAPFDTGLPLAPGHYNLNSHIPGIFIQSLQIQVTFTHS